MSNRNIPSSNSYPIGMPKGPWQTFQEAQEVLTAWAMSHCKTPFKLIRGNKRAADLKNGVQQIFHCSFYGKPNSKHSKKCDCKFKLNIEETRSGIVVKKIGNECLKLFHDTGCWHGGTHKAKYMVRNFDVPSNILDRAEVLVDAGDSCSKTHSYIVRLCRENDIPISFNYQDIYNYYYRDKINDTNDDKDVLELLATLKKWFGDDNSRTYYYDHDAECRLDKLFVCLDTKHTMYNVMGKKVVLFDTKYRNNAYKMALGCFVTMDTHGNTQVIAASLVRSESIEMFEWVFEHFKKYFGGTAQVIITDGDQVMARVIQDVWPGTKHLLCAWHLYKNFFEHIYPLFVGASSNWIQVAKMWWSICKRSDIESRKTFNEEWQSLQNLITERPLFKGSNIKKVRRQNGNSMFVSSNIDLNLQNPAKIYSRMAFFFSL
jgi:hypothetical protein